MQQCMYLFRENMPIYVYLYENVNKKVLKKRFKKRGGKAPWLC